MGRIEELKNEIQGRFDELSRKQQKIAAIRERARTEKEESERQTLELNKRLPELLADIHLGKVPKLRGMKELARMQKERARLRDLTELYPFLDEGLRREEAKIPHLGDKIVAVENKLREYEKVKAEMLANPHDRHHDLKKAKLRRLADDPVLNCQEETEAFLKGEVKEAKYPVVEEPDSRETLGL